ncbi:hypothetical protein [Pseudorhodoferax sp.]|uniref:hypothetical protein n=1 Tax=Pseudorhodoferax sp. TaxID=1993553 RepID=UPI0039E52C20
MAATSDLAQHPMPVQAGWPADTVLGTVFLLTAAELAQADADDTADGRRATARLASGDTARIYVGARPGGPLDPA